MNMDGNLQDARKDYAQGILTKEMLPSDPFELLTSWLHDAELNDPEEYNAMCLSTIDEDGNPDARMVLAKGISKDGLTFYTNDQSQKGRQLAHHAFAALTFYWRHLERQVRIRGRVVRTAELENDGYFASRPRSSQLGAWSSNQSSASEGPDALEAQLKATNERFSGVENIPRPPHWRGYTVQLEEVEFWQGRPSRLHHRWKYSRNSQGWTIEGLQP